jgi:hypothetical protein
MIVDEFAGRLRRKARKHGKSTGIQWKNPEDPVESFVVDDVFAPAGVGE